MCNISDNNNKTLSQEQCTKDIVLCTNLSFCCLVVSLLAQLKAKVKVFNSVNCTYLMKHASLFCVPVSVYHIILTPPPPPPVTKLDVGVYWNHSVHMFRLWPEEICLTFCKHTCGYKPSSTNDGASSRARISCETIGFLFSSYCHNEDLWKCDCFDYIFGTNNSFWPNLF